MIRALIICLLSDKTERYQASPQNSNFKIMANQQFNKRWEAVFRKLAPSSDEETGLQTSDKIKLSDLKKYLDGEKSYTVSFDWNSVNIQGAKTKYSHFDFLCYFVL